MRWVKLDVSFFTHPKALAAGRDGRDVWLAALTYAAQQSTDGVIHAHALPIIGLMAGVTDVDQAASRLVEVGLWETHVEGFEIHGFLEWQESREEREEWLQRERERKRRAREQAQLAALAKAEPYNREAMKVRENVRADSASRPRSFRAREEEKKREEKESSSTRARPDFAPLAALGIGTTTTSLDTDPRADRALRTYASRMAAGKEDPRAYASRIVANGAEHLDRLNTLARTRPELDPDELADLYLTERRPAKPSAATCAHCGGPRHPAGTGPCPTLLTPEDAA